MKLFSIVIFNILLCSCASTVEKGQNMTPQEEHYLGRSVAATILKDSPLYKTDFNNYLNTIGKYISYNSLRPETFKGYYFGLIKNERSIALSSPGGIILISTGLLKKIKNEDQLAAILAHEVSHIALFHSQKAIDQSSWGKVGTKLGVATIAFFTGSEQLNAVVENYDELITDYSSRLINGIYNKEQEIEADKAALYILSRTGYDSEELRNVILGLSDSSSGGLLSNHPSNKTRVAKIKIEKVKRNLNEKRLRTIRFRKEKSKLELSN